MSQHVPSPSPALLHALAVPLKPQWKASVYMFPIISRQWKCKWQSGHIHTHEQAQRGVETICYKDYLTLRGDAQHEGRHSAVKLNRTDTTLDLSLFGKGSWGGKFWGRQRGVYIDSESELGRCSVGGKVLRRGQIWWEDGRCLVSELVGSILVLLE